MTAVLLPMLIRFGHCVRIIAAAYITGRVGASSNPPPRKLYELRYRSVWTCGARVRNTNVSGGE